QFSTEFHLASIIEMCRVAWEARIFPLLTAFAGEPSPHLEPVMAALREQGYEVEIRSVNYEFQKGGDKMLSVRNAVRLPSRTSEAGARGGLIPTAGIWGWRLPPTIRKAWSRNACPLFMVNWSCPAPMN